MLVSGRCTRGWWWSNTDDRSQRSALRDGPQGASSLTMDILPRNVDHIALGLVAGNASNGIAEGERVEDDVVDGDLAFDPFLAVCFDVALQEIRQQEGDQQKEHDERTSPDDQRRFQRLGLADISLMGGLLGLPENTKRPRQIGTASYSQCRSSPTRLLLPFCRAAVGSRSSPPL